MNSFLFIFITFLVILPVNNGNPMQLTLLGSHHPVTASLREAIVLQCHLSPRTNVQNMEITWFRSHNSSYVHLYRSGKDHLERQQPEYQGRTEFLKDGIGDGKIGLKIFNVSLFDEGPYYCSVKNGSFQREATLDMKVAGKLVTELTKCQERRKTGGAKQTSLISHLQSWQTYRFFTYIRSLQKAFTQGAFTNGIEVWDIQVFVFSTRCQNSQKISG